MQASFSREGEASVLSFRVLRPLAIIRPLDVNRQMAFAGSGKDSRTTQMFINYKDSRGLGSLLCLSGSRTPTNQLIVLYARLFL